MSNQRSPFAPFDLDTGGGTEFVLGASLRISAAAGSIEAKGSQVSASSIPVVIASDQVAIDVSGATVTVDSELPAAAILTDNFANPTAPGVGAFGMVWDGATWDRAPGTSVDGTLVNLGTNNDVTTELPAAAALTDANGNPTTPMIGSSLLGWDRVNSDWTRIAGIVDGEVVGALNAGFLQIGSDGTNYQAILTDTAGAVSVNVLSGGGSDVPTNPVTQYIQTVDLADGVTADLDTTASSAANKKLAKVSVWSSVAYQADIHTVDNSVESPDPIAVGGGQGMQTFTYVPPHRNFHQLGSTAGNDAFRVKVTNLSDGQAADANATIQFQD